MDAKSAQLLVKQSKVDFLINQGKDIKDPEELKKLFEQ